MRYKNPREYMEQALAGQPVQQENDIAAAELPFEFMMNALRLTGGFSISMLDGAHGIVDRRYLEAAGEGGVARFDHARSRARGSDAAWAKILERVIAAVSVAAGALRRADGNSTE